MTYYRGPFVYTGSATDNIGTTLDHIIHPEGIVRKPSSGYVYYYAKADHTGSTRILCHEVNESMVADQTTDYYPYGLSHTNNNLDRNRYLYSGKELQDQQINGKMLQLYDFGSRNYDPILGRWFNIDPALQFTNPYLYCGNSPMMYQDPNGEYASPIYDDDGNLLGTDDEGLGGKALFMNESDFEQGMSHSDAVGHDMGYGFLANNNARTNFWFSYSRLRLRPDWDGVVTFFEANEWFRTGNGQPLFVDVGKIDLSPSIIGDFTIGEFTPIDLLMLGTISTGLVYGSINVTLLNSQTGKVLLGDKTKLDNYGFEKHEINKNNRNFKTKVGHFIAGEGIPYDILGYGTPYLPARRFWRSFVENSYKGGPKY